MGAIGLPAVGHAGHDVLFDGAVGFKHHNQAQVIIGLVRLFNNFAVKAFRNDDTLIVGAFVEDALQTRGMERTEDIPRAKVNPGRIRQGTGAHRFHVVLRRGVARERAGLHINQLQGKHAPLCKFTESFSAGKIFQLHYTPQRVENQQKLIFSQ